MSLWTRQPCTSSIQTEYVPPGRPWKVGCACKAPPSRANKNGPSPAQLKMLIWPSAAPKQVAVAFASKCADGSHHLYRYHRVAAICSSKSKLTGAACGDTHPIERRAFALTNKQLQLLENTRDQRNYLQHRAVTSPLVAQHRQYPSRVGRRAGSEMEHHQIRQPLQHRPISRSRTTLSISLR